MPEKVSVANGSAKGVNRVDLAYSKLASSEVARDINRDIVLELVRTRQPVSRADLSRISGLQPSTISAIIEQLLTEKWVVEGAAVQRPRGRRPTLISLNDDLVMLAADIRPNQAIVAVVDLNGRFLAREVIPLVSEPERGVNNMVECMKRMQRSHPSKTFEGVGISLPGRVDPATQRLILSPNLKWSQYDIKSAVEKRISLRVELSNAANAALLSEMWFGRMDGVRNAALITISEGVGTAILANGQIIVGKDGLAGEFGHIPIDPSGPQCGCGMKGCWEMFASSRAALRYYAELNQGAPPITIQELLHRAEDGDKHAVSALTKQAAHLGRGLRLVTAALSPEVILLTGDITASWSTFGPIVQNELESQMLAGTAPRIMITSDGELARLRGAGAIALQRHSGYYHSPHAAQHERTTHKPVSRRRRLAPTNGKR
ncbi:xylose repressor [Edaphobacter acidisoli]|uniref:Xylose repressor n=1 Tax=Edaphobacter acidisoli TaxID=2040573 RepID=A0A916W5P8_9BACT|nr:ROK family protein [Edaphobacter acidisoli]GGA68657.1 xylose repressor [Edaphobacter acidisoli]